MSSGEAAFLTDEKQRRSVQAVVTHFLAEMLSRGVADAGVLRGEPSRQVSLRRGEVEQVVARDSILSFADLLDRAEAAASAVDHPDGQRLVRRSGRRVLPSDHGAGPGAHGLAAGAASGQRGPGEVLRHRRRADHDAGTARHRSGAGQARGAAGGSRPAGQWPSAAPWGHRHAALQRGRDGGVLAADTVLPAGDLRPACGRWCSSACCSRWCCC